MGERDLAAAPPPAPERSRIAAGGWTLLGLLLAVTLLLSWRAESGVAGQRGWRLAAALLLALAAIASARSLARRLGPAAPLWIAVWLFASLAGGSVLWAPRAAALLACAALAWALVYGGDGAGPERHDRLPEIWPGDATASAARVAARWGAAGALLGVVGGAQPLHLTLLLPALLAAPPQRARTARACLLAGAAAGCGAILALAPAADLFAAARNARLDPALLRWSLVDLLAGRHGGLLAYFLPLVLGFAAPAWDRGRWALPLAVAASFVGLAVLAPFSSRGEPVVLGNAAFLPLYPALWFVAGRRVRSFWPLAVGALAGAFVWPAWVAMAAGGPPRPASVARRWLPVETTLRDLPGAVAASHGGLELRLLDGGVAAEAGGARLRLRRGEEARLVVASPRALATLVADFDRRAATELRVRGAEVGDTLFRPDGSVSFELRLGAPRRHRTWRGSAPWHFYTLSWRMPGEPGEVGLRLTPGRGAR